MYLDAPAAGASRAPHMRPHPSGGEIISTCGRHTVSAQQMHANLLQKSHLRFSALRLSVSCLDSMRARFRRASSSSSTSRNPPPAPARVVPAVAPLTATKPSLALLHRLHVFRRAQSAAAGGRRGAMRQRSKPERARADAARHSLIPGPYSCCRTRRTPNCPRRYSCRRRIQVEAPPARERSSEEARHASGRSSREARRAHGRNFQEAHRARGRSFQEDRRARGRSFQEDRRAPGRKEARRAPGCSSEEARRAPGCSRRPCRAAAADGLLPQRRRRDRSWRPGCELLASQAPSPPAPSGGARGRAPAAP
jgi:hypothetical protein